MSSADHIYANDSDQGHALNQTVWHSDGIPEISFLKKLSLKNIKTTTDDKITHKELISCVSVDQCCIVEVFHVLLQRMSVKLSLTCVLRTTPQRS